MKTVLCSVSCAWLLIARCWAAKDDSYYPYGRSNPSTRKAMYWQDASNIIQDIDQFDELYVQFHSCAWSPFVSDSDESEDDNMEETDYWYMNAMPEFGPNIAFSLYGSLKGRRFSGCGKKAYINSFYTTSGFPVFANALASAGVSNTGVDYSASCENGVGLTCHDKSGSSTFVMVSYNGDCTRENAKKTTIPSSLAAFNTVLRNEAQCTKIYASGDSTPELLQFSRACSLNDYAGACPDPYGMRSAIEREFVKLTMLGSYYGQAIHGFFLFCVGAVVWLLAAAVVFLELQRSSQAIKNNSLHAYELPQVNKNEDDGSDGGTAWTSSSSSGSGRDENEGDHYQPMGTEPTSECRNLAVGYKQMNDEAYSSAAVVQLRVTDIACDEQDSRDRREHEMTLNEEFQLQLTYSKDWLETVTMKLASLDFVAFVGHRGHADSVVDRLENDVSAREARSANANRLPPSEILYDVGPGASEAAVEVRAKSLHVDALENTSASSNSPSSEMSGDDSSQSETSMFESETSHCGTVDRSFASQDTEETPSQSDDDWDQTVDDVQALSIAASFVLAEATVAFITAVVDQVVAPADESLPPPVVNSLKVGNVKVVPSTCGSEVDNDMSSLFADDTSDDTSCDDSLPVPGSSTSHVSNAVFPVLVDGQGSMTVNEAKLSLRATRGLKCDLTAADKAEPDVLQLLSSEHSVCDELYRAPEVIRCTASLAVERVTLNEDDVALLEPLTSARIGAPQYDAVFSSDQAAAQIGDSEQPKTIVIGDIKNAVDGNGPAFTLAGGSTSAVDNSLRREDMKFTKTDMADEVATAGNDNESLRHSKHVGADVVSDTYDSCPASLVDLHKKQQDIVDAYFEYVSISKELAMMENDLKPDIPELSGILAASTEDSPAKSLANSVVAARTDLQGGEVNCFEDAKIAALRSRGMVDDVSRRVEPYERCVDRTISPTTLAKTSHVITSEPTPSTCHLKITTELSTITHSISGDGMAATKGSEVHRYREALIDQPTSDGEQTFGSYCSMLSDETDSVLMHRKPERLKGAYDASTFACKSPSLAKSNPPVSLLETDDFVGDVYSSTDLEDASSVASSEFGNEIEREYPSLFHGIAATMRHGAGSAVRSQGLSSDSTVSSSALPAEDRREYSYSDNISINADGTSSVASSEFGNAQPTDRVSQTMTTAASRKSSGDDIASLGSQALSIASSEFVAIDTGSHLSKFRNAGGNSSPLQPRIAPPQEIADQLQSNPIPSLKDMPEHTSTDSFGFPVGLPTLLSFDQAPGPNPCLSRLQKNGAKRFVAQVNGGAAKPVDKTEAQNFSVPAHLYHRTQDNCHSERDRGMQEVSAEEIAVEALSRDVFARKRQYPAKADTEARSQGGLHDRLSLFSFRRTKSFDGCPATEHGGDGTADAMAHAVELAHNYRLMDDEAKCCEILSEPQAHDKPLDRRKQRYNKKLNKLSTRCDSNAPSALV